MISSRPVDINTSVTAYGPHYVSYQFTAHGDTKQDVVARLENKVRSLRKARTRVRIGYPIVTILIISIWALIAFVTGNPGFLVGVAISAFLCFVLFVRFVWTWLTLFPDNIKRLEAEIIRLS